MKITFERFERDCPHNAKQRQADGHNILYDFKVLIDGEHRATFKRGQGGRRPYDLYDVDHNGLRRSEYGGFISCKQNDFHFTINQYFDLIPTLAQVEERREARTEALARYARVEKETAKRQRVERAGPALLEACKESLLYLDAPAGSPRRYPVGRANLYAKISLAIAQAEETGDDDETVSDQTA